MMELKPIEIMDLGVIHFGRRETRCGRWIRHGMTFGSAGRNDDITSTVLLPNPAGAISIISVEPSATTSPAFSHGPSPDKPTRSFIFSLCSWRFDQDHVIWLSAQCDTRDPGAWPKE